VPDEPVKAAWSHHNPVRIVAGMGAIYRLPELTPPGPVLLVTTPGSTRRGMTARVQALLGMSRVIVHDRVSPNPELDDLDAATADLRGKDIRSIVALGGGSALDAGKVLSVTLPCGIPTPLDYVLRKGNSHAWQPSLPLVAIPTTAGTGSEVTSFATVWDRTAAKKHSVTGETVFPRHALLDPELTLTLPHQETLYTALDAISHALESLWNKNRTPVTEALSLQALKLSNEALPVLLNAPTSLESRTKMQQASLLAGLAISQTRTAIAHSISYPLTILYGVPHGLACSFTLAAIWKRCQHAASEILCSDIVKATMENLEQHSLNNEIIKYVNEQDIIRLIGDMFLPERADNFIINMDQAAIHSILKASTKSHEGYSG